MKTKVEIIDRLRELVHRHRRRYLKRNLTPCALNCIVAKTAQCEGCEKFPDRYPCQHPELFKSVYSKDDLYGMFKEDIRNPYIMLREYRDIAFGLWVLGEFDGTDTPVVRPDNAIDEVEKRS